MNEYISYAQEEKRKETWLPWAKMLIAFMAVNIILRLATGFFMPRGVVAALCPTISFVVVFLGVFGGKFKLPFGKEKNSRGKVMSTISEIMFKVFATTLCLGIVAVIVDLTGLDFFTDALKVSVPIKGFGGVVYALYMCFIAPVMHEMIFRGAVMNSLKEKSEKTAVLVSALLYALLHGVYITAIYAFVMGVAFGKTSLKAKSAATTIKANVLASVLLYSVMFTVSKGWIFVYVPLLVIFGFFALLGLLKMLLETLARKKSKGDKADFSMLLSAPVVVAATLMVVEDVLFLLI